MPDNGFDLIAQFTGEEAERNRIPAYEASQSLYGLSRGLVLVTNYLVTNEIRKRAPFTSEVSIFLQPLRRGSWETLFTFEFAASIIGGLGAGIVGNLLTDGIKVIWSRAVGKKAIPATQELKKIENEKPGDVDALVDAVEPSLVQAHRAIPHGASQIVVVKGDHNIIKLNSATKEYVEASETSAEFEEQDVSVGSFNVNTRYGRAFFHDLQKTVPFRIADEAEPDTQSVIASSLSRYADRKPSTISIKFRRVTAPDGRTKRIRVYSAKKPPAEIR